MKKTILYIAAAACLASMSSCVLDLYPRTSFNEGNVTVTDDEETTESQYSSREDMLGLRNSIYSSYVRGIQEAGYQDWLVYSDVRADNAYCGSPTTGEIVAIEANNIDGDNKNVDRDWSYFLGQVTNANQIICNIDRIFEAGTSDTGTPMTQTEHDQWKAEAFCWRAYNLYCMSQLWGDIPLVTEIPPAITAENIEEVYELYYPPRTPKEEVYAQMIEDLTYATQYAPEPSSDKSVFTKGFAYGLLARVYAENTSYRDWSKVAECCAAVESYSAYSLCENYGDLWAYDDTDAKRNTTESIFEVPYTRSSGNWVWMMFHRNYYNPDDSYTWAKWITPSRNLIAAYEEAGDTERMNASIIWDECGWSYYYPSEEYAFMHKMPTNANSIILMRLGEIYLLHAEALCMQNDLAGATEYVNKTRTRAKLAPISAPAGQDAMIDAVLDERRLELAFEGFRFFDLVRHGKAAEVHDAMPLEDSYWQTRYPLTDETILMPIPTTQMDNNPNLEQNPGY